MPDPCDAHERDRWARLRFSIVGPLLAAPPGAGELRGALLALSGKSWCHPVTGLPVSFGTSTLERWYYAARAAADPVAALKTRVRIDCGQQRGLTSAIVEALAAQYHAHPSWSAQLHYDNLRAALAGEPPLPSYSTLRRHMKAQGWFKQGRARARSTAGMLAAAERLQSREVRSFELDHVNALWHLDFHYGSRKVLTRRGTWLTPMALAVLDDRSRLACHMQWYLDETAESLVHGFSQALQRRGLPRALMTDNGAAMMAEEFGAGLHQLGIVHQTTLPYSPYQNAKQESFWGRVEGRLMAMLEGVDDLNLELLNTATGAWVEQEYQRSVHSEIGASPLQRYLAGPDVGRECPGSEVLRAAFRLEITRAQRRSDGTVSLHGQRFEIPSRYRHLQRVHLRYARWDLRSVDLVDARRGSILCALYPLDKSANADGQRRVLDAVSQTPLPSTAGMAPLLRQLMAEYAATGLPPAYLPTDPEPRSNKTLLALYGLKWNPFSPELPTEALFVPPKIEDFFWRIEQAHVREGGFALIHGDPGTGKSVVLRLLAERLERLPDVTVAVLSHPQSNLADFYREMGELFAVGLRPHNRWGGFKSLRERWLAHLEGTRLRPVLLIDEAQEMSPSALSELRLLASARFDSRPLLSIVLAGDARLTEKLRREELLPLGSRIRARLAMEYATREELAACLEHLLNAAGNASLMTSQLRQTLCDHAAGNYRILTTMSAELLSAAAKRETAQLDEKLYLEIFAPPQRPTPNPPRPPRQR